MVRVSLLICLIPLICCQWVAQGALETGMEDLINTRITPLLNKDAYAAGAVNTLRNALTAAYNGNWNVLAISPLADSTGVKDAVVFGYAYNNRWFWNNPNTPDGRAWIVWKDYNGNYASENVILADDTFNTLEGALVSLSFYFTQNSNANLLATLLPDSATANNWDNVVRLSDAANGLFVGSYTVFLGENVGKIDAAVSTYAVPDTQGSNIFKHSFTYGSKKMTLMILYMSRTYSGS